MFPKQRSVAVESFITMKWKVGSQTNQDIGRFSAQLIGVNAVDETTDHQLYNRSIPTNRQQARDEARLQQQDCVDCPVLDCTVRDGPVPTAERPVCACPRKRKELQEDSTTEQDRKFSRSSSLDQLTGTQEPYGSQAVAHPPPRKRSSRSVARRGKRSGDQRSHGSSADSALSAVDSAVAALGDDNDTDRPQLPAWLPVCTTPGIRAAEGLLLPPDAAAAAAMDQEEGETKQTEDPGSKVSSGPCWVSQQLALMLRREEQGSGQAPLAAREGAGHASLAARQEVEQENVPGLLDRMTDIRHREMNRYACLPDRRLSSSEPGREKSSSKASRSLYRELASVRRKIEAMEQQFILGNGYRPSQADKQRDAGLKTLLAEHARLKREIRAEKDCQTASPYKTSQSDLQATSCADQIGELDQPGRIEVSLREVEEKLREITEAMEVKRLEVGRPYDLLSMSLDQLCEEKAELQAFLLEYEKLHGRPDTSEAKEATRELYDRYRLVKRLARRSSSARSRETASDLVTIPEGVEMTLTLASPAHRLQVEVASTYAVAKTGGGGGDSGSPHSVCSGSLSVSRRDMDLPCFESGVASTASDGDKNWHALSREELQEIQRRVREEKRAARRAVKEFEESFRTQTGRRLLKEDREPFDATYRSYKVSKSKLKLINALLSKLDRRQFEKYSRYSGRYER